MSELHLPPGTVLELPGDVDPRHGWQRIAPGAPALPSMHETAVFVHRGRQLSGIRSRDEVPGGGGLRWHLSVAHRKRIPSWEELGFARDCLLPEDLWLVIGHPPRALWMNYNPRVLHLWEFVDRPLIEAWTEEGLLARMMGRNVPDSGMGS